MEFPIRRGTMAIQSDGKLITKSFLSGAKQLGFTTTGNLFQLQNHFIKKNFKKCLTYDASVGILYKSVNH